jgi:NhaP-type Na+/H+ or K+/H+ antiporter
MNEVVLGTIAGILMGPYGANVFDPRSLGTRANDTTLEVMRVVLAIGLFAIGVELPRSYMAKHAKGLAAMVVPTMIIGWFTVAGRILLLLVITQPHFFKVVIFILFPRLSFVPSLAIAACLTPTDPIISAAIVGMSVFVQLVYMFTIRKVASSRRSTCP